MSKFFIIYGATFIFFSFLLLVYRNKLRLGILILNPVILIYLIISDKLTKCLVDFLEFST